MKIKFKRFGKCVLSAVLAAAMLMSATIVGSVGTAATAETTQTQTETVQNDTAEPAAAKPEKKALQASGEGDTITLYFVNTVGWGNVYLRTYNPDKELYSNTNNEGVVYQFDVNVSDYITNGQFYFLNTDAEGVDDTQRTVGFTGGTNYEKYTDDAKYFVPTGKLGVGNHSDRTKGMWINLGDYQNRWYVQGRPSASDSTWWNYGLNYPFEEVSTNLYRYNTSRTVVSWSAATTNDNKTQYFNFRKLNSTSWGNNYGVSGNTTLKASNKGLANATTLTESASSNFYFSDLDSNSGSVVFWLDTSSTPKFYFTLDTDTYTYYFYNTDNTFTVSSVTAKYGATADAVTTTATVTQDAEDTKLFTITGVPDGAKFIQFSDGTKTSTLEVRYGNEGKYFVLDGQQDENDAYTGEWRSKIQSMEDEDYYYVYFDNILDWTNVGVYMFTGNTTVGDSWDNSLGNLSDSVIGKDVYGKDVYEVAIPKKGTTPTSLIFRGNRTDNVNANSGSEVRAEVIAIPDHTSSNKYFIPIKYISKIEGKHSIRGVWESNTLDEISIDPTKEYIYFNKNDNASAYGKLLAYFYGTGSNATYPGERLRRVHGIDNMYALEIDSTYSSYTHLIISDGSESTSLTDDTLAASAATNNKSVYIQVNHRFTDTAFSYSANKNQVFTPLSSYTDETDNDGNYARRRNAEWRDLELPLSAVYKVNNKVRVYAKTGTVRLDGGDEFDKYSRLADVKVDFTSSSTSYSVDGAVSTGDRELSGVYYKRSAYYDTQQTPAKHYRKVIVDADKASPVTVTVTIRDDATNHLRDRYYVRALIINGETKTSFTYNSDGVYTYTFTPNDTYGNYIEVTPVYYYNESSSNNNSGGTSKYITLEVDDFTGAVKTLWGSTLAVYAWYYNTTNPITNVSNAAAGDGVPALGGYPGQPMVYVNGHYEMQIPRYLNGDTGKTVKGITLNNYTWDDAHTEIVDMMKSQNESNLSAFAGTQAATVATSKNERNCQTYDYDDFIALSQLDAAKIRFTFKYKTYNSNGTGADGGNFANAAVLTSAASDLSFVTGSGGNGWEPLMDDNNIPVDLFDRKVLVNDTYKGLAGDGSLTGDYLTQAFVQGLADSSDYQNLLYVVSDGYENYYEYAKDGEGNKVANSDPINEYIGEYATMWYVYERNSDGTFNYLGALPPSAFLSDAIKADETLDSSKYLNYSYTASAYKSHNANAYVNSGKALYTTYESLYNTYKNRPVVIAYESSLYASGRQDATNNPGNRCDGRWTYSPESPTVQSKVKIQIVTEDANGNLTAATTDSFDNTTAYMGTTTKAKAYFTNSEFNKTVDSGTVVKNAAKNFTLTADPYSVNDSTVYVFAGWYYLNELKDTPNISSDSYTKLNSGASVLSTTGSMPMDNDYTFIATYKVSTARQIIFTHQLYSAADTSSITTYNNIELSDSVKKPAVHNGTGTTEIRVDVYNAAGTELVKQGEYTDGLVSFTGQYAASETITDYKFKVFLKTTPDTDNTLLRMLNILGDPGTNLSLVQEGSTQTKQYDLTAADINALFGSGTIATVRNYSDLSSNNVSIRFNYYDRAVYKGAMAEDIDKTPTSITVDVTRSTEGDTGIKKLENTVAAGFTAKNIVTDSGTTSSISSVLDEYYFWPTQAAAVAAVSIRTNFRTKAVYGNDNVAKHFDYYGFKEGETAAGHTYAGTHSGYATDWVTYYDAAKNVVSVSEAQNDPTIVDSIEVWGLNVPKEYTVTFSYPTTPEEAAGTTPNTGAVTFSGYYNERVGRQYNNSEVDGVSTYLTNYGISLNSRTGRKDITAPASFEKTVGNTTTYYFFDGWYNSDGVKVSTDRTYANRITGNMTLTAHYTSQTENTAPAVENSVTVTSNGTETYISDKGVERVRLLTQINVNGYQGADGFSDHTISMMAMIYVKLPASADPSSWTSDQKSAIYAAVKTAVESALENGNISAGSETGVSVFTVALSGDAINSLSLSADQNTIAYTYDVVWDNSNYDGTENGTQITLTNKNRIQFSLDLKKTSVADGGANSNIIAVAAIKSTKDNNVWKMSEDGVVYHNGEKYCLIPSGASEETIGSQESMDSVPANAEIELIQIYSVSDDAPAVTE